MPRTKKQQRWGVSDIMIGVGDACWIISGEDVADLRKGDRMLFDRALRKPRDGDYAVYEVAPDHYYICLYDSGYEYAGVCCGIVVAVVRQFERKTKRGKSSSVGTNKQRDADLKSLRGKLTKLEHVPENEEIRFQMESEIYKLEHVSNDEWPDVIGS